MADSSNKQTTRPAGKATAAPQPSSAASQDQMWQKFDAMLQEFLKMEQTSPAAERQPAKASK
jgi:hypothetical protein